MWVGRMRVREDGKGSGTRDVKAHRHTGVVPGGTEPPGKGSITRTRGSRGGAGISPLLFPFRVT